MSALVGPGELHWFENDTGADFAFVEFWASAARDGWTVRDRVPGPRRTDPGSVWAPVS